MNKDDKNKILAGSDHYLNLEEGATVAKRVIKKMGNKPIAFFDILEDGDDTFQLALGTRGGKKYRGKGYGSQVTKEAMDWLEKNKHKVSQKKIVWGVRKDNTASIKLAEKYGFELEPGSENEGWVNYVKKIKKQ